MDPSPPPNGIPYDLMLIIVAMLVSGAVLLITAIYVRMQNKGPVTKPLIILLVLCAAWSFLNALVLLPQDQGQKILFQQIEYLSIIFIPVALLVTILTYLGRTKALCARNYSLLLVVPMVSVVMLLTNDYHHLFFTAHASVTYDGVAALLTTTGPYYLVHIVYTYALVIVTVGLLFHHMMTVEGVYRRRDLLMLVGISLPFIGDGTSIMWHAPSPGASWAPLLFMVMGFVLLFALFKYHTFDLMPLARGLVWKNTPDPLFVIDGQGLLVDVNNAGSKLLDRDPDQLIGERVEDLMSSVSSSGPYVLKDGPDIEEITVGQGESTEVYEILRTPVLDDTEQTLGTLVLLRDITSQKAIREATLQNEYKYRMLIEKTPFPMAVVGSESGSVNLINVCMEELMKGSRQEILSKDIRSFFLDHDDLDRLFSGLGQDRMVENFEAALLNVKGEHFWAYLSAIPVTLGGEQVIIMTVNDISDRKLAEALKTANKKLNLLQGITRHDLMNKFMAISGYIELLKMAKDTEKRDQIMSKLEMNANAAQELIRFTHDYENLGVQAPIWQSVSDVVRRAKGLLDLTGIQFVEEVGPLQVFADSMLDKVFYNLMENSLRHGERVKLIRIYTEDMPGQGLCIVYEDDGAGITYEEKKFLFQQGHGKNTGQGMFLTREILLITGMTISEDGEPGKGVRFRIKILPKMYSRSTSLLQASEVAGDDRASGQLEH